MKESLSPDQRIRKRSVFETLFKKGRSVRGKFLTVRVCEDPGDKKNPDAPSQIGIMVSRKTSPRAVKRNIWKRRIREAFRKNQAGIKSNTAVLVMTVKQPAGIPSYLEIQKELLDLLAKTGTLK